MPRCAVQCRALPWQPVPALQCCRGADVCIHDLKRMDPMSDAGSSNPRPPVITEGVGRLNSWKKIAAHFSRDVTTVQRWERREGMPVHRHLHDKQGSVYAFRSELDAWWEGRRAKLADSSESVPEPALDGTPSATRRLRPLMRPVSAVAIIAVVLAVAYGAFRYFNPASEPWRNPLANATFTRLTEWPGSEQAAEISPDGRWASFLADHDGHMDAWLTQIGSGSYRNLTHGEFL
jgi:hypothetical protein